MPKRVRVGIIGARADRGWAGVSHVPAVQAVPGLELRAVATSDDRTAQAAAEAFEVPIGFGDPYQMIRSAEIDVVSVVVKTPEHRALVLAAIEAGKVVLCEWPLGRNLSEAEELAEAAGTRGVRTAIGLQGRFSPWVNHIKRLVEDGFVGCLMSTTLIAADDFSLGTVAQGNAYMLDASNGANPLTIQCAHFLDTLCHALGEFESVGASLATTVPAFRIRETGETVRSNTPDQVAVAATLVGGAVACVQVRAGRPPVDTVSWEIQGSDGFLKITAPTAYLHWGALRVEGRRGDAELGLLLPPEDLFDRSLGLKEGPQHNVAYLYSALAKDMAEGTRVVPDFRSALSRHRTIDAIALAAGNAERVSATAC